METRSSVKGKTVKATKRTSGAAKASGKRTSGHRRATRKWSARVTEHSDALDVESNIFASRAPLKIAQSLKQSAERSKRRKGTVRQSAMSMLNFYINRAGKNLSAGRKRILERAKAKLKALFEGEKKRGES